jgi:hypothetical protein
VQEKIFLDTKILRTIFPAYAKGEDWRSIYGLATHFRLVTAHKCLLEMYGILRTSILTQELAMYGCKYSMSRGEESVLRRILNGNDFQDIFWYHQTLEAIVTLKEGTKHDDEHTRKLRLLARWRSCYERVRSDFDKFIDAEKIEYVLYSTLFNQHEWQTKLEDLAVETLIPEEDIEIVLSAWYLGADIFLTGDEELIRLSFSLPLDPDIPAFCSLANFEETLAQKRAGMRSFPGA